MGILALEVSFILTKHASFALQSKAVAGRGILADAVLVMGSILPSVLTCPILAITVFSFFLPLAAIYNLVGSKENITILAVIVMSLVVAYRLKTMEIKQKQNR